MQDNKKVLPAKEELIRELSRLKEVSMVIEELTCKLSTVKKLEEVAEIKLNLDNYTQEQSRIIDKFLHLSTDEDSLHKFRNMVKEIDTCTQKLSSAQNETDIQKARERMINGIDTWINLLEKIIIGVISRAN